MEFDRNKIAIVGAVLFSMLISATATYLLVGEKEIVKTQKEIVEKKTTEKIYLDKQTRKPIENIEDYKSQSQSSNTPTMENNNNPAPRAEQTYVTPGAPNSNSDTDTFGGIGAEIEQPIISENEARALKSGSGSGVAKLGSLGKFDLSVTNLQTVTQVKDDFQKLLDAQEGKEQEELSGESAYKTYSPGANRSGYKDGMLAVGTAKDLSIFSNFNGEPAGPNPGDKQISIDTDGDGKSDGSITLSKDFFQEGVDTKIIYRGERYEIEPHLLNDVGDTRSDIVLQLGS